MDTRQYIPPPAPDQLLSSKSPQTNKKSTRSRRSDKKRKDETTKQQQQQQQVMADQFPSQSNMDMGYMSGESQCTPGLMAMMSKGRTQLSGYNSSGYDTEYPSLPEDHSIPPLVSMISDQPDTFYGREIKREQFSPSSQMEQYPYQLSQPPPPYNPYKHGLQPLPEVQSFGPTHQDYQNYSQSYPIEAYSSGYSSFGGSPIRMVSNDDSASIMGGSIQRSAKGSDLNSSSHSSFSTLSSRLSSPMSNSHGGRDYSKHSYRNLRPPDLILRPQQPSYSVQMSDIKAPPCFRRQSDELSLRSSHSSRYSGSEYSDDLSRHSTSSRDPLPLPQSMQPDFMSQADMVTMTTDPQYMSKDMTSPANSYSYSSGLGSVPLKHFEPALHKQHLPLPMIFESQVQADSPNMVIGSMSLNASQLHQDNLLFESMSTSHSYIGLPH